MFIAVDASINDRVDLHASHVPRTTAAFAPGYIGPSAVLPGHQMTKVPRKRI
jgi:hypothetical protein